MAVVTGAAIAGGLAAAGGATLATGLTAAVAGATIGGAISAQGESGDAVRAQQQQNAQNQQFIAEQAEKARADAIPLFQAAQLNRQRGFQGALDVLGQTIPQQLVSFQRGQRGAQGQLIRGVDPFQQAILGTNIGRVDAGRRVPLGVGFAQQQLPDVFGTGQALGIDNLRI